jgi:hypothetical protein
MDWEEDEMTAARWRLFATPCVVVIACLGCSSSEFQTAAGEDAAGTDTATTGDTATGPDTTKPLCVTPPTATVGETAFCNFEAELFSRCGQCESCRQTNLNGCVQFGDALSKAFKEALIACKDVMACGDYTTYANDKCVQEKLAAAVPTDKQKAAKDAYCTKCPTNADECAHFFDFSKADAGPDAGARGIGEVVMIASDDIVQLITDGCGGGIGCNPALYGACSIGKFCGKTAPDACKTGFYFK